MTDSETPADDLSESTVKSSSWRDLLAKTPPDTTVRLGQVTDVGKHIGGRLVSVWGLFAVDIPLWCDHCDGERVFSCGMQTVDLAKKGISDQFFTYWCRNCTYYRKTFAVRMVSESDKPAQITAFKLGETPPYGPHTPSRVISLVGPDRELFLKGRRAELRGLGIGAFAYYRRVVENQKNRLLAEARSVAEKLGSSPDSLSIFDAAIAERQFTRAIEMVRDVMPERLRIRGHNPFTLLHDALSNELHSGSDDEALAIATSVREVLTELANRISDVLQERSELDQAVSTLLAKRSDRAARPS